MTVKPVNIYCKGAIVRTLNVDTAKLWFSDVILKKQPYLYVSYEVEDPDGVRVIKKWAKATEEMRSQL